MCCVLVLQALDAVMGAPGMSIGRANGVLHDTLRNTYGRPLPVFSLNSGAQAPAVPSQLENLGQAAPFRGPMAGGGGAHRFQKK